MDESDHLALLNAADEEVVSQRGGWASQREKEEVLLQLSSSHTGGTQARENSTRLGRVVLTVDLFACEGEEHEYGGDAGTRALSQSSHTCGQTQARARTRRHFKFRVFSSWFQLFF